MDEIQVSDQGEDGLVRLYADTVVRTRIAGGPGELQFVLVVIKQAADGNTGHIILQSKWRGLLPQKKPSSAIL